MPSWGELLRKLETEIHTHQNPTAGIRYLTAELSKNIANFSKHRNRNTIVYFSSFLHKGGIDTFINDKDINGFMETVYGLDKSKGLDLILHTPGGEIAATEQIIYYLRNIFNGDIVVIVPQLAMSAGSMISVSAKEIIMGKQSCLGPFDPQLGGVPCQSILKEFNWAVDSIKKDPVSLGLWQTIINKLTPTFLYSCRQAIELSDVLANEILKELNPEVRKEIKRVFGDNDHSKVHSRHINRDIAKKTGLNITYLEENSTTQDLVLTIHRCCMLLADRTNLAKLVQNNNNRAYTTNLPIPQVPQNSK